MTSPVLTEGRHTGGFILAELPGTLSRETGLITNGGTVEAHWQAGTVMGATGEYAVGTPAANPGNTGNGTVGSTSLGTVPRSGLFRLVATAATTFNVIDPDGNVLGTATAGTAFTSQVVNLTITAGGTAFVAGDAFDLPINFSPSGLLGTWTGASGEVGGLLYEEMYIDPGATLECTMITRDAEVIAAHLVFDAAVTGASDSTALQNAAIAGLAKRGIRAR
ncbi:MAG: hypothetical protein KGN77_01795 [Xanthomonadaceae bacterium]|nr:hypothetical protein [Xanthomonadaceae bacterium]